MADWERALDKQLATYLWWHTPIAERFAGAWVDDVNSKYARGDTADRMIDINRRLLWRADPIYVTPDMADLLEAAYPSFEPEPLREDDLIIPDGFALLPRLFYIPDVWGKQTSVRAIAWQRSTIADDDDKPIPGVHVSLFCNADDRDDYSAKWDIDWMRKIYGDAMSLVVSTPYAFGDDIEVRLAATMESRIDRDNIDVETARTSALSEIRLLQCFWRLTKQQIAVGFPHHPSRATRRRSERAEYPDKYVTVVTLRRPRAESSEPEHHTVDWKMRWIVSGHWRWQPYKDGSRRQIWIAPYVKGPEDRPLSVRKMRVFQWSR
jgi:hypothetical protein